MHKKLSVALTTIIEQEGFSIICPSSELESVRLYSEDVNRPGLQLVGFYDYFDADRLQVIGMAENAYLGELPPAIRRRVFRAFFSNHIPALILARGIEPYPECLEMARRYDVTVLSANENTSSVISRLVVDIKTHIAPRETRHGVLVEIYGEGVLITGDSGIGKSEAAIELVKRGHRLIADDAVEIVKTADNILVGSAPVLIEHYMELRGIGVVDVRRLFGAGAVKKTCVVDMIVDIKPWDDEARYDRFGEDNEYEEILDVSVPKYTVPVKPGRNMAVILEVAAMNNRERKGGFNAALELTEKISRHMERNR